MSNDRIEHYAKMISEQVASNRISGMRTMEINEVTTQTAVRKERKALHSTLGGDMESRGGRGGSGTGVITSKSPDEVHKHLLGMGYEKATPGKHEENSFKANPRYKKTQDGVTHTAVVIPKFSGDKTGVQHHAD
jgi:hypothetical protein